MPPVSQVASGASVFDPKALVRSAVRSLPSYSREAAPSVPPRRVVRLDWNESPYGPSPKARSAIASFDAIHRYPEIDARSLREALGGYLGAPADDIVVGAGLDDVLNTLALLLIEPGDRVVISEPTFGLYRPLFSLHGAEIVDVPLGVDFALDADALIAAADARTKLVIICNPNNPTGNLFDPAAVAAVAAGVGCVVAIDEAYAEFAGVAHRPLMDRHPNVAVLRTMSKFAGLAGMRVGYGVFPAALMPFARPMLPAFGNVSAVSVTAAVASLDDVAYLEDVVARVVRDRDALAERLRRLPGVVPWPSATNFLLVRLPIPNAGPVVHRLAAEGVFVRQFPRPDLGLLDCLRVTVGTPDENDIFVAELSTALREVAA